MGLQLEIDRAAAEVGLHLTPDERSAMGRRVEAQLATMQALLDWRPEGDDAGPSKRQPTGSPPAKGEDPYHALLWTCRIEGATDGILRGKTATLKDNIAVAGVPLTCGSELLANFIPDEDATVASRLLAAGAVITGKANMDTFAGLGAGLGGVSDFGPALNPHDVTRLSGGSSSGSGAAVAGGLCDISIGGDQGGSIRIPAAWCGVVGLKPTFGLVPHTGVLVGGDPCIDHIGPLARSTADVAAALQAIAGVDGRDPRQPPSVGATDYVTSVSRGADGLTIGLLEEGMSSPIQPEVKDAVLAAMDTFVQQGARVTLVSVPGHARAPVAARALNLEGSLLNLQANFAGAFIRAGYPEAAVEAIGRLKRGDLDRLPAALRLRYLTAAITRRRFSGLLYARAQNLRTAFAAAYDRALAGVDLLAMPTATIVAPPRLEDPTIDELIGGGALAEVFAAVTRNCSPFNYTGHPALSLPCARAGGMPVGLQLVGPRLGEKVLLCAAGTFERAVDWAALTSIAASGPR